VKVNGDDYDSLIGELTKKWKTSFLPMSLMPISSVGRKQIERCFPELMS
jgi:hypothetical protein